MRLKVIVIPCLLILAVAAGLVVLARGGAVPPLVPERAPALAAAPEGASGTSKETSGADPRGLLGVIIARESVDLSSKVQARVRAVHARLGDQVARGALLVILDGSALRKDLAIAEADLQGARAEKDRLVIEARQAGARLERRLPLVAGSGAVISGEDLEGARFSHELADARVRGADAVVSEKAVHVLQLREALAEMEIRAPFDGVVSARLVEPGATVGAQTPLLKLINPTSLWVRFAFPETQSGQVRRGAPIIAAVAGYGELRGVVEKVAPEVDAAARMILAEGRLELPKTSSELVRTGVVARVRVGAVDLVRVSALPK
jgi:macrolide-specific efflux system membrane fusion protein